jgi:hypothetical protein
MSLDAPYFYGARLPAVLDDAATISERVLGANDLLMECLEGRGRGSRCDLHLGQLPSGPNNTQQIVPQLGIADAEGSRMLDYEYLILAPGSRDLVLSFPGWELPGVLGANGGAPLVDRYQALSASRMVVLGSNNLALRTAKIGAGPRHSDRRHRRGRRCDPRRCPARHRRSRIAACRSSCSKPSSGSSASRRHARFAASASMRMARRSSAPIMKIACDTVCMAFGAVPNVELASLTGCRMVFDAERGGWVPELGAISDPASTVSS